MVEEPIVWATNADGARVCVFIFREHRKYGLTDEDYSQVLSIADEVLKARWAARALSREFLEDVILKWCRAAFGADAHIALSSAVLTESDNAVRSYTMWAPVAHLEIETPFPFGPAQLAPITAAMLDHHLETSLKRSPRQAGDVRKFFDQLRAQFQGLAAVVLDVEAEPRFARESGLTVADAVVGLLRFFSDASYAPWLLCPNALIGSELIPQAHSLLLQDDGFSYTSGIIPRNVAYWQLSTFAVAQMESEGLNEMRELVLEEDLSPFQRRVRTSILAYSKGTTLPDVADRLVYTLSALESLLLRDASEPIQQNLGDRMAFLIARDVDERKSVVANLREAYGMRSRYIHHRVSLIEESELEAFIVNARLTLLAALKNIHQVDTPTEFLDAIDRLKYGG